jgi:hypothetical protein
MSSSDMMPTVVLVHGGFVDGSGWQGVYEHLKKTATTSPLSKIRRFRSQTTSPRPIASSTRSASPSFSWATPMAGR